MILGFRIGFGEDQRLTGFRWGLLLFFFAGIAAGHFGLSIDPQMLNYAESFGLIIFVYALGLQVGPGFFGSFRKGGMTLSTLGICCDPGGHGTDFGLSMW